MESKEQAFWNWFRESEDAVFHIERDQKTTLSAIAGHLSVVDSALTFEIGPISGGKREFIITAGGLKRMFPAVQALVERGGTTTCG